VCPRPTARSRRAEPPRTASSRRCRWCRCRRGEALAGPRRCLAACRLEREGDLDLDHEGGLCEGRGGRGAEEGRGLDGGQGRGGGGLCVILLWMTSPTLRGEDTGSSTAKLIREVVQMPASSPVWSAKPTEVMKARSSPIRAVSPRRRVMRYSTPSRRVMWIWQLHRPRHGEYELEGDGPQPLSDHQREPLQGAGVDRNLLNTHCHGGGGGGGAPVHRLTW
jgi:hypothetical protein